MQTSEIAARTHVFPIHGGDQAVCINPPEGYGPSAEVATVWPSAESWGPDAELIVLALRCAQLDELVGSLAGQQFFDASGTSGMLAVVASRYGAARAWAFTPEVEPGRPSFEWLSRHYPACTTAFDLGPAALCQAAVFNFYRYPRPAALSALGHELPVGARLVVVGALASHLGVIHAAAARAGLEPVESDMPWVDEMQVVTLVKRRPSAMGSAPSPTLPRGAAAQHRQWSALADSVFVSPGWRIDSAPRLDDSDHDAITIEPSLAYGSGGNEVTKMALHAIGRLDEVDWQRPLRVLDIGCGTGILAIACGLRGATDITAMDICPNARALTEKNAEVNGVKLQVVGEVDEGEPYDLIVANLYGAVWPEYIPRLPRLLRPGGLLVSAGTPRRMHDSFEAALTEVGLRIVRVHRQLDGESLGWPCAVSQLETA